MAPSTGALTSRRRSIKQEHTEQAITFNHDITSLRYVVELYIAHLINWKMPAKGYLSRLSSLPITIRTIAKLELYRLGW